MKTGPMNAETTGRGTAGSGCGKRAKQAMKGRGACVSWQQQAVLRQRECQRVEVQSGAQRSAVATPAVGPAAPESLRYWPLPQEAHLPSTQPDATL